MNKKIAKKGKAKPIALNPAPPAQARRKAGRPKNAFTVLHLPPRGCQGRFAVADITGPEPVIIARYLTPETAAWVRQVMQDAAKA